MKRITLLFVSVLCMVLSMPFTSFGQTGTIQIGSGTSTVYGSSAMPVSNYVYNYNQQIITAAEYAAGGGVVGDITTIRYNATDIGTLTVWNMWTVYIGNTSKTEFSSTTDWVPLAELTEVFSGTVTAVSNEWFEVTFTAPFNYTGGNIVVAVHEYTPGWMSAPRYLAYTSTDNSGIYYRNDGTNPDPAAPPTATGRVGNLPQIQFVGTLASCLPPSDLAVPNFTTTSADLAWTGNGSSTNWDIEWGIDGFAPTGTPNVNDTGDNPYTLGGLDPGTDYEFYVRADCGADDTDVSAWVGPYDFTTAFVTPDCATTPFPANGAIDVASGTVSLTWTAPAAGPSPTAYNVYVYDDASGTNPVLETTVATASADLTISDYNTEIFWAAIPVNGTEEATGCDIWSFTTGGAPIGAVCENSIIVTTPLPYITSDDTANYGDDYDTGDRPPLTGAQVANGTGSTSYLTGNDVVYAFTPAQDGSFNFEATFPSSDWYALWLFEGCAPFTSIVAYHTSTTGTSRSLPEISLIGGTTYYVVISTWSNSPQTTEYTLTISENTCTNATTTYSVVSDCEVSGGFLIDVEITDMGSATAITIADDQGSASQAAMATGTYQFGPYVNGTDVVFTITDDNDANCTQTSAPITQEVCPPANDDCANATMLTVGTDLNCTNPVSGTTIGATESLAGCVGTANDDVWYGFVATGSAHYIIINNTSGSTDIVTQVFDACGGASLVCQDTPNSPISLTGLTAGNTYYFRIYTYSSTDTTRTSFDVCVGTPPPPPANDDCEGAIALTPGMVFSDNPVDGTVAFATDDTVAVGCGSDGPGVWYSVVVPADGNISIEVGPDIATGDTGFDSVIEVFSGACGSLVSIDCDDDTAATGNFSLLDLTGLTPGSTIYVRVWEYGGNDTEPFSISAYSATLSNGDIADQNTFTYFPNPVKNELNLRAQSNIQDVAIYNMLGQEVLRTAPNAITSDVDMSTLQTGTYFVKVTINDVTETIRVIKQ